MPLQLTDESRETLKTLLEELRRARGDASVYIETPNRKSGEAGDSYYVKVNDFGKIIEHALAP